MIKLTQQEIIDLFAEKLKGLKGVKTRKSIVNNADPTELEVIEAKIYIEHGFDRPDPQTTNVVISSTCWGTDISFTIDDNGFVYRGFLVEDKWHRVSHRDFFRYLKDLINFDKN